MNVTASSSIGFNTGGTDIGAIMELTFYDNGNYIVENVLDENGETLFVTELNSEYIFDFENNKFYINDTEVKISTNSGHLTDFSVISGVYLH